VDGLKKRSSKVFRSKGGRIDSHETTVWSRFARSGEIHYSINRKHPLLAALLGIDHSETKSAARAVLDIIEQTFPVSAFGEDASQRLTDIHQTETDPHEFKRLVETSLPMMLHEVNGDFSKLSELMKHTEPFSRNWKTVLEILKEKGWSSAKS
jgi:hypothetical protein